MAEKKSLVKNSIFIMSIRALRPFFRLLPLPISREFFCRQAVGRVGYANTIVAYFVLIASLGIPTYGVKAIAQSR